MVDAGEMCYPERGIFPRYALSVLCITPQLSGAAPRMPDGTVEDEEGNYWVQWRQNVGP